MIRLDKFLSENTAFSRSEIRTAIRRGNVTVDGIKVTNFSYKIDEIKSVVSLSDEVIKCEKFVYFLLNKPKGIISASNDKSRKTVVDLVPSEYKHYNLFPVGRLDRDTTGLLLITNDGDFAHRVILPKNKIEKSYLVSLDGEIDTRIINEFKKGVVLADGTSCLPAVVEVIDTRTARVVLTEGKYHQIKRMFGVFGFGVNELHRERMGLLTIPDGLNVGECIKLDSETVFNYVLK